MKIRKTQKAILHIYELLSLYILINVSLSMFVMFSEKYGLWQIIARQMIIITLPIGMLLSIIWISFMFFEAKEAAYAKKHSKSQFNSNKSTHISSLNSFRNISCGLNNMSQSQEQKYQAGNPQNYCTYKPYIFHIMDIIKMLKTLCQPKKNDTN